MRTIIVFSRSATGNLHASPVYEMLFIKELRPSLNTQSDSISERLFSLQNMFVNFFLMSYCFPCIYRLFLLSFFRLQYDV